MGHWENSTWVGDLPTVEELGASHCQCCRAKDVPLYVYPLADVKQVTQARDGGWPPVKTVCALCSGTITATATEYSPLSPEIEILRAMCFIGNEIIKAIKK
jgi:hypothetical protein